MTQADGACLGCGQTLAGYSGQVDVDDVRHISVRGETVTVSDGVQVVRCERCPDWVA